MRPDKLRETAAAAAGSVPRGFSGLLCQGYSVSLTKDTDPEDYAIFRFAGYKVDEKSAVRPPAAARIHLSCAALHPDSSSVLRSLGGLAAAAGQAAGALRI